MSVLNVCMEEAVVAYRCPSIPSFSDSNEYNGCLSDKSYRRSLSPSGRLQQYPVYSPRLPTLSPYRLRECRRLGRHSSEPSSVPPSDCISVYSDYSELISEPLLGIVLSSGLRVTHMKKNASKVLNCNAPFDTSSTLSSASHLDIKSPFSDTHEITMDPINVDSQPSQTMTRFHIRSASWDSVAANTNEDEALYVPSKLNQTSICQNTLIAKLFGVSHVRDCLQEGHLKSMNFDQLQVLANELRSQIADLNDTLVAQLLMREDLQLEKAGKLARVEQLSKKAQESAKKLLHRDEQRTINHQNFSRPKFSIFSTSKAPGEQNHSIWSQRHLRLASFFIRRN